MNKLHNLLRSAGYSLIEQAVMLPILLAIVLAAFDLNKALQSYTAVKEATNTALRCLYTVDGQCVQAQGDERIRYYDYYKTNGSVCEYCPQKDYSGQASYLRLPVFQFSDFRATVLGQVYFDDIGRRWEANKWLYATEAEPSYVLRWALFPYVTGSDPHQPVFRYLHQQHVSYPKASSNPAEDSPRLSLQKCSGNNCVIQVPRGQAGPDPDDPPYVTLATFRIRPAAGLNSTRPCYVSSPNDVPAGQAPNEITSANLSCHNAWPEGQNLHFQLQGNEELTDRTFIVLWAKGSGSGTEINACAKVGIRLRHWNARLQRWEIDDLGGQVYTGPEIPAHFFPRGAPLRYVKNEFENYEEFQKYQKIEILYNTDYELQFAIFRPEFSCNNPRGRISWTLSDVVVYTPLYRMISAGETPVVACQGAAPRSGIEPGFVCNPINYPAEAVEGQARLHQPLTAVRLAPGSPRYVPKAYTEAHALQQLAQVVPDPANYDLTPRHTVTDVRINDCPPRGQSQGGGSPNYGVPETPQGDGFIHNSANAAAICPAHASAEMAAWGVEPQNIRWKDRAPESLPNQPVSWTKRECNWPPPPKSEFPGDLPLYAKLTWNGPSATGSYEALYTGPELPGNPPDDPHDPEYLRSHDPRYSCAEFPAPGYITYDDPEGHDHTFFSGMVPNLDLCDWRSMLRELAVQHYGMPPMAYFHPIFSPGHHQGYCQAPFPEFDPCSYWYVQEGQGGALVPVAGGPYPEGTLPDECQEPGVHCLPRFNHFGAGAPGQVTYSPALAAEHGRRQLEALLPWISWQCQGPRCARIEIDAPSGGGLITARSSVELPMNTLLGRTLTVTYTGRERWEGDLVR